MEIFEGIRNGAVSEIIQNFELKRVRNGIDKEDVEKLLNQVCSRYEQDSVNVVPATEHLTLKEKTAKLEKELADAKNELNSISESNESLKEDKNMISEILIDSKNRAKHIVEDAEEAAKTLRDKSSAEAVALRQKTQAERKKILDEAEALKKDIIGKATDKAMAIEDSKRNVLSDADAEKTRIINEAIERANTLEEECKKRLEDANAEAESIILNAKETAQTIVKEGEDSLEESKFAAEGMIEKAKIEFEKIKADAAQEKAAVLEKAKAKAATIVSNGYYEQEQLNIQNKELADKITAKKEEFAAYIRKIEANFSSMNDCLIDFKKDLNIMFLNSPSFEEDIQTVTAEPEDVKSEVEE